MGWIVAIICIILVVIFWRIFVPLAIVAAVGFALLLLYIIVDSNQKEHKRAQAEQEVREKFTKAQAAAQERIAKAKATAGDVVQQWEVSAETDPASGEKVPRYASVLSDDGLCQLQVEQRINATRLAGIHCPGLKVSTYTDDIEVKFDNRPTSDKMRMERFSSGDDVYIPSKQWEYGHQLPYDVFLQRMTEAKKVALLLTIEGAGQHWITFSLVGSGPALIKIGAIPSESSGTQKSTQKTPGVAQESTQKTPSVSQKSTQKQQSGTPRQPEDGNTPKLPANAKLNVYGNDWQCQRGYRQSGNECIAVQLPPNAKLNVYGNGWQCQKGFRQSGNECVAVQIPPNAMLNVYGNDWQCQRGFRRSGNECVTVQIPANAMLNVYGNGWQCVRGYRQSGSECVPVGVSSTTER